MINTIMRILTINIILRIIEANLEDIEPTEVEIQVVSSDAKIFMAEVNEIDTISFTVIAIVSHALPGQTFIG